MKSIREEILSDIWHFENMVRGLEGSIEEETDEHDRDQLSSRKWTYKQEVIPMLKRLLELAPEPKTATIWMIFRDNKTTSKFEVGTYDFNTPQEKMWVNEFAKKVGEDRKCFVEVVANDLSDG